MWKYYFRDAGQKFHGRKKAAMITAALLLVLMIAISAFWMAKRGERTADDIRLKIIPDHVDLQIKDVHYTEVGDPDLTWEIRADSARYVKKDNLAYFDRILINLIGKDGKTLSLTGKEGVLHTDTKDADISGEVVVVTHNGDMVKTDKLHYIHSEKKIRTDREINLQNPHMTVHGVGMSLSLTEGKVSLLSHVKAVIKTEKKKK